MKLHAVGFCGADDSVHPNQIVLYSHLYPFVEFGVLFRPDKEGQPRYASEEWVVSLSEVVKAKNQHGRPMNLAAHLCERRVDEVLRGEDSFVQKLRDWGFRRIQVNATANNGVDTSVLVADPGGMVQNFLSVVRKHPGLEFIVQTNEETRLFWEGVTKATNAEASTETTLKNISMLLDESKGTGVLPSVWSPIPPEIAGYTVGYAGGIGPENVSVVLEKIKEVVVVADEDDGTGDDGGRVFWIDMESKLRSQKNGRDVFDLDKCYKVVAEVCGAGYFSHPSFLGESSDEAS
eukprot:CAMPEP_0201236880 /NCGR_PEP_ID=MMETSP0852-20130820/8241_1 /ASSEMBLY_ACC=CAM_ASM_000632 /TAXON_ID=183588 /ORGANISM="Pseudo-nitzschia fraudulenta, Strain WWA7" /LENGTH=290 /DNA_ID=CAMNT_0047530947 /DNA_START=161 /DNA_END=1033 /DNA_ORIENTATION=-